MTEIPEIGEYQYGFHDKDTSVFRTERGLTEKVVREFRILKKNQNGCLNSV